MLLTKNGKYLVSFSSENLLIIWNLDQNNVIKKIKKNFITKILITPDDKNILIINNNNIEKIEIKSGNIISSLSTTEQIQDITFINNIHIAIKFFGIKIEIWNINLINKIKEIKLKENENYISFIPDTNIILCKTDFLGDFKILSLDTLKTIKLEKETIMSFSTNNIKFFDNFVVFFRNNLVLIYDKRYFKLKSKTFKPKSKIKVKGNIYNIIITKDNENIIIYLDNSFIQIWNIANAILLQTLYLYSNNNFLLNSTSENNFIAWFYNEIFFFYKNDNSVYNDFTFQFLNNIRGILYKENYKLICYDEYDEIKLLDLKTLKIVNEYRGYTNYIHLINNKLVCGSSNGFIKICDSKTKKKLYRFKAHKGSINILNLTFNENIIISGSSDKTLKIWNIKNGSVILNHTLIGHKDEVINSIILENEKKIITSSFDKTIKIWDIETGKLIKTINNFNNPIRYIFSSIQLTKNLLIISDIYSIYYLDINSDEKTPILINDNILKTNIESKIKQTYEIIYEKNNKDESLIFIDKIILLDFSKNLFVLRNNSILIIDIKINKVIDKIFVKDEKIIDFTLTSNEKKIILLTEKISGIRQIRIWDLQNLNSIANINKKKSFLEKTIEKRIDGISLENKK